MKDAITFTVGLSKSIKTFTVESSSEERLDLPLGMMERAACGLYNDAIRKDLVDSVLAHELENLRSQKYDQLTRLPSSMVKIPHITGVWNRRQTQFSDFASKADTTHSARYPFVEPANDYRDMMFGLPLFLRSES